MGQPPDEQPKKKPLSAHQSGIPAKHGKPSYDPDAAPPARPGGLTIREEEIVELLAEDLTNEEISKKTGTALATVKSHVHNILFKIKGRTRGSAIIWSLRRQNEALLNENATLKAIIAEMGGSSAAPKHRPD